MMSVMDYEILTGCGSSILRLALAGTTFGQHLLLRPSPPLRSVPRLDALDALRALVAIDALATGLLQRRVGGKALACYSGHPHLASRMARGVGIMDSRSEKRATSACCS